MRLQRLVQSPKKKNHKSKHSKLPEPTVTRAQGVSILFRRKGSGGAAAATTAEAKVNAHSSDDADDIVSQGATTEKLSKGGGGASPSDQQKPGDSVKNLEPSFPPARRRRWGRGSRKTRRQRMRKLTNCHCCLQG
jgi:hypothetical protein